MTSHPTFDLQGHRGCRGLMPENTIPAMMRALEFHVTTLEMDVSITADSICILSHEPFFNHEITTKPDGNPVSEEEEKQLNIYKMTYDQVRQFDVGKRVHPRFPEQQKMAAIKPTLAEVFEAVKEWCSVHQQPIPFFNIETKTMPFSDNLYHPVPAMFVRLLMEEVIKAGMEDKVVIQSFDYRTLQILHRQFPHMRTAALVEDFDKVTFNEKIKQVGFKPAIYSPHYSLVTEELVRNCHQLNMLLIPWTVNDTTEAKRLVALGVDGFITDFPDRIHGK